MLRAGGALGAFLFLTCAALASADFPNPVVLGAELGEFRHGTFPSIGKRTHVGVDLVAPCGTSVHAIKDGEVIDLIADESDRHFDKLGYMVLIQHEAAEDGRELTTLYLHLESPPSVRKGQHVYAAAVIGKVGDTGFSLGCHLHFEARHFLTRFHPVWGNIYGDGDQRTSEAFTNDWENPEKLFEMHPDELTLILRKVERLRAQRQPAEEKRQKEAEEKLQKRNQKAKHEFEQIRQKVSPTKARAQTVIEILKKQNNPKTVSPAFIHPSAQMLMIVGEQRIFLDRSKILALTRLQKTLTSAFNMSNFRILNEYSAGNIISVTYSFDYKLKAGAATTSGTNLVHEVLIKTPGGLKELFIVQQQ